MEMEPTSSTSCIQLKLKKLLDLFLQPEYKIKNDVYISTLITHIKSTDLRAKNGALDVGQFSEWVLKTLRLWEDKGVETDPLITFFLLNILSELSYDVTNFRSFEECQVFDRLLKIINVTDTLTPHIIKLGYVRVFTTLVSHNVGIEWLRRTRFWESILDLNASEATIYIHRETQASINKLLRKTAQENLEFCCAVVGKIIHPLTNNHHTSYCPTADKFPDINQEELYKNAKPKLKLICFVLEDILCNNEGNADLKLAKIFDEQLRKSIMNYMKIVNNKQFVYDLSRVWIALELYNLYKSADFSNVLRSMIDIFKTNVSKQYQDNVFKLCNSVFCLSKHILSRRSNGEDEQSICYLNQLLLIQLLPLLMVPKVYLYQKLAENYTQDSALIASLHSLLSIDHVIELNEFLTTWQRSLVPQIQETHIAIGVLSHLMSSKKWFSISNADVLHKCFSSLIKDLTTIFKERKEKRLRNLYTFCVQILEASRTVCSDFNIFHDSNDVFHFVRDLTELLKLSICERITERLLKLIHAIINRYLIDQKIPFEDEARSFLIDEFIPILHARLSADAWEVRDSALEVFTSLVHLSNPAGFSQLQKTLISLKIPRFILTKAVYDVESFVRVTGCQCLSEMIKNDAFWNDLDDSRNLMNCLVQVFDNEDEGLVRKEIISALRQVYCFRKVSSDLLYGVMTKAVYDFYWEVKIEALKFWKIEVELRLREEGLLECTLADANGGSVVTSDADARTKIQSVLSKLAEKGCLKILADALQDDCDIEVAKCAFRIVQRLKELFREHDFTSETETAFESENIPPSCEERKREQPPSERLQSTDLMTASEFVSFIARDFGAVIEDRQKWLKGIDELDSLLDDMLKNYEDELNDMDCY